MVAIGGLRGGGGGKKRGGGGGGIMGGILWGGGDIRGWNIMGVGTLWEWGHYGGTLWGGGHLGGVSNPIGCPHSEAEFQKAVECGSPDYIIVLRPSQGGTPNPNGGPQIPTGVPETHWVSSNPTGCPQIPLGVPKSH